MTMAQQPRAEKVIVHEVAPRPGFSDPGVAFTTIFNIYAVREMGLEIITEAAKLIAQEYLSNPELVKLIDRDRLRDEITAAIGRAFVEKLLGKEEAKDHAESEKPSR